MMLVLRSHKYHSCHITDVEEKDDEEEEVPFESSDKGNHVYYDSNTSLNYDSSRQDVVSSSRMLMTMTVRMKTRTDL